MVQIIVRKKCLKVQVIKILGPVVKISMYYKTSISHFGNAIFFRFSSKNSVSRADFCVFISKRRTFVGPPINYKYGFIFSINSKIIVPGADSDGD